MFSRSGPGPRGLAALARAPSQNTGLPGCQKSTPSVRALYLSVTGLQFFAYVRPRGRVCTVLVNTGHQVSRFYGDSPATLVWLEFKAEGPPMSVGLVTEMTKGTEHDPMVDFR